MAPPSNAGFVPLGGRSVGMRPWSRLGTQLPPADVPAPTPMVPPPASVEVPAGPTILPEEVEALRHAHAREVAALHSELGRARAESHAAIEELNRLAGSLTALHTSLLIELRAHAADVIIATATHLAGEGLRVQPELLDTLITEAIAALGMDGLVLRVSIADEARVRAAFEPQNVRVLADERVSAGCIAQGTAGTIDASLDTAFAALTAAGAQWQAR